MYSTEEISHLSQLWVKCEKDLTDQEHVLICVTMSLAALFGPPTSHNRLLTSRQWQHLSKKRCIEKLDRALVQALVLKVCLRQT